MAYSVQFKMEGVKELEEVFNQMNDELGEKDAKRILNRAVRLSMKPVLDAARSLAPEDTGALRASLQIEARKPSKKDKRSKYVSENDAVIGLVTTAPGAKLARIAFKNKKTDSKFLQIGIKSDARAVANEFGTAKMPAKPFMRPALESNKEQVTSSLANSLRQVLEKYKARQARKAK